VQLGDGRYAGWHELDKRIAARLARIDIVARERDLAEIDLDACWSAPMR